MGGKGRRGVARRHARRDAGVFDGYAFSAPRADGSVVTWGDSWSGGDGIDTVSYLYATSTGSTGVTLDLSLVNASGQATASGISGADIIKNIENLTGSNYADRLTGNGGANILNGGTGTDTVSYVYRVIGTTGVTVSLAVSTVQATGSSGSDTLTSIENLTGSTFNDSLTGSTGANNLNGGAGDDLLSGGLGNDILIGGLGNDTLSGGGGGDIIRFDTLLNATTNHDTISDFNVTDDTIQLENAIFTSLAALGTLAAGSFRSGAGITSAADANDYLIYNSTTGALYYDADGSGAGAAAVQFATVSGAPVLSNLDFVVT
jgi:Ca2+-binding RTX toxin-like protein